MKGGKYLFIVVSMGTFVIGIAGFFEVVAAPYLLVGTPGYLPIVLKQPTLTPSPTLTRTPTPTSTATLAFTITLTQPKHLQKQPPQLELQALYHKKL